MPFSERFYKDILDNLYDAVYFVNTDRKITYWNKAAERLTGYAADEVEGRCCRDNILMHVTEEGRTLCNTMCPLMHTILSGDRGEAEICLHHRDGHRVPVSVRVMPMMDETGVIVGAIEVFNDNSRSLAVRRKADELHRMAMLCPLTNAGNRRYAETTIDAKLAGLCEGGLGFGVLFMDVDNFKKLNDSAGHAAGDQALRMVAQTLIHSLRDRDVVCRWGGEEFVAILDHVDLRFLSIAAERCRALVEQAAAHHGDQLLRVTVSVGASLAQTTDTRQSLIERTDALMYKSKSSGKNRVSIG
ncbi:MAG: sensor domain-containing diguanylate cyclase [Candidatus Hydrogenedentes bacterium]|nr:sensor domain-containing diguanylate cyclase [Candidatus Hydrogenedentota bacterium]